MRTGDDVDGILLKHARDKIVVIDRHGFIKYANEATERILGWTPQEYLGKNAFELVHPGDRQRVQAKFQTTIDSDEPQSQTVRYQHRTAEDEFVWLESQFSNAKDSQLDGFVVASREITAEQEAKQRKAEIETYLNELMDAVGDVVWMITGDWSETLFVNAAYEEVYGQSPDRLRDDPYNVFDVIHPDDQTNVQSAMERLAGGASVDVEYRVNPDQEYQTWVWVRGQPIIEDGEVVRIVGFTRDITDRRRRERQLVVMDNLLRHNVRNNLTTIIGRAEEIAASDDAQLAEYGRVIRQEGKELLASAEKDREIIDLLTADSTPEPLDLVTLVTNAIETAHQQYPDMQLDVDLSDTANAYALKELQLAVLELVENAVEHHPEQSPAVTVTLASQPETINLTVTDNCPPIAEEEYQVLTGDREMDMLYHTSGLGLWLVHWAVDLSGGHIEFASSEHGNKITISLQRVQS